VQPSSLIMTRRLDTGQNLEETGGKVKRAFIAVVGAGVLLSVGVTVAFDAIARRRDRRRLGEDPSLADLPDDQPDDRSPELSKNMPRAGSSGRSSLPIRLNGTSEETIVLPRPMLDRAKSRDSATAGGSSRVIRQRASGGSDRAEEDPPTEGARPANESTSAEADRTIVLPRATATGVPGDTGGRRT
jgi:hypothetical protein